MSQQVKSLIASNPLGLSQEQTDALIRKFEARAISFLSPDKEAGPFLCYCCGDSLEQISIKCNIPLEIVQLTAIQYRWLDKVGTLGIATREVGVDYVAKDLINSLLVASSVVIKRRLGEIIAGKVSSDHGKLIPGDIYALDKLMRLVNELYKITEPKVTNVVHADKVQIVNNGEKKDEKELKLSMLREIEAEGEAK